MKPHAIGIDPGPETSGYVYWSFHSRRAMFSDAQMPNCEIISLIDDLEPGFPVCIEVPEVIYRGAGATILSTCFTAGRFYHAAEAAECDVWRKSPAEIRRAVCGTLKSNDATVRRALIRYIGGPGTKTKRGPTWGITGHAWRALAAIFAEFPERMTEPTNIISSQNQTK